MQCNDWHRLNRKKDRKLLLAEREDKLNDESWRAFLALALTGCPEDRRRV
jgi:hypothetical protein